MLLTRLTHACFFCLHSADGYDDLVVGAPLRSHNTLDPNQLYTGSAYVLFGRCDDASIPTLMDVTFLDGSRGIQIYGKAYGEESGFALASAGDINNNGADSILVGSPYFGSTEGAAYVVTGC